MKQYAVEASGGCQCGAVRYHATAAMDNAHICHCRMCQKAVGNFFEALVGVPKDALTWTRGKPATFRSSANVERGFCANCGTPLFYNDVNSKRIALTIGSFDHPELFPPVSQDGIEGRLPFFASLHAIEAQTTTEQESEAWAAAIKASSHQHPDHDTSEWPIGVVPSDDDKPLEPAELAAINARLANATPGPWESWIEGRDHWSGDTFIRTGEEDIYLTGATHPDHDFIAAARQDIPKLLAEVSRLSKLLIEK